MMTDICAIDFETACPQAASACAVGLARVRGGVVTDTFYSLIKPPVGMEIIPRFTEIHGIRNADVRASKNFAALWPQLHDFIGNDVLCAHNAPFDRSVLNAVLDFYGIEHREYRFECTVRAARKRWPHLLNHKLNTVSAHLGVELKHHEALSDALACAKIWVQAVEGGR